MWCEMPESHQGMRPPAVKKSRESWMRALAHSPIPTMTTK
jgi:hypothetical protein